MLLLAARPLAEQKDCIMIGDRPEDKGAADACGIKFFWASVLRNEQEGVEKCQIQRFPLLIGTVATLSKPIF
jgi:phosphoglycolate phosphatase-like HAD superfamily hydrolase